MNRKRGRCTACGKPCSRRSKAFCEECRQVVHTYMTARSYLRNRGLPVRRGSRADAVAAYRRALRKDWERRAAYLRSIEAEMRRRATEADLRHRALARPATASANTRRRKARKEDTP